MSNQTTTTAPTAGADGIQIRRFDIDVWDDELTDLRSRINAPASTSMRRAAQDAENP
jgi:hypothetical protein